MALNFTVSYTFAPSTTISSSQVNTNTSDVANVFTGLEAKTKSFSFLKVDASPTSSTEVAIKSYVDSLMAYRKPVLQYNSATVVNVETGINGTSGQLQILFPDGTMRTDSTTTRIQLNTAQTASLTGTAQSGIQTGSVSSNTWYWVYAVKSQVNSTDIVIVADKTNGPVQASYATLNSNFGTSGWVYLGAFAYGDNSGTTGAVISFLQSGNKTIFNNTCVGQGKNSAGLRYASTAGAISITWTYGSGNSIASTQIPANILMVDLTSTANAVAASLFHTADAAATIWYSYLSQSNTTMVVRMPNVPAAKGAIATNGNSVSMDIFISGFIDNALGVGPTLL